VKEDYSVRMLLNALISSRGSLKTKELIILLDEINRQLKDNEVRH